MPERPIRCPACGAGNSGNSRFCGGCGAPLYQGGPDGGSVTRTAEKPVPLGKTGSLVAGKYRIVEEIGHGGMGVVYKAEDVTLKRYVALKFLPPQLVDAPELKERFLIEAQAAAALSHPNICVIHEVGESSEQPYIAMEFVEGETLRDRIRNGPLTSEEALEIVRQIAAGLEQAHGKGIIHRDIKSANIMVTPKGQVKVMDFGLAKLLGGSSLTRSRTTLGTVAYMSPEQARGDDLDHRTDIWSLGVVLYELLGGRLPFRGDHDQAVIYSIVHQGPEPLKTVRPGTPPEIDRVVGQALAKNPGDRYQSMAEFRGDLEAVAAGLEPRKARRTPGQRKVLRLGAGVISAALVIALALVIGLNIGGLRDRTLLRGGAPARSVRLAVLPFANLSGDLEQEYLTDGLTQEMIAQLGRLHPASLSVIARTSVMRYKKTATPIDQIARELGVDYVLEGSARREADRLRITAELIQARDQTQLWAETYERDLAGILAVQSDVARRVAESLALTLLPAERTRLAGVRLVNPEAYDAYLKGSQLWPKMTNADIDMAQQYFEMALAKDPNYAMAYVGMTWVWIIRNQMGYVLPGEALPRSKAAAQRALQLDASLGDVHYALAVVRMQEWDWANAGLEWQQTIELSPNISEARGFYSHYLNFTGHPQEALAQIKRALELDPISTLVRTLYAVDLLYMRRYDEAIDQLRVAQRAEPENQAVLNNLWNAFALKGMDNEAFETAKSYISSVYGNPKIDEAFDRGFAQAGYKGGMRQAAEALVAGLPGAHASPIDIADLYIGAGETAQALHWLEKSADIRDPNLPYLGLPWYDSLRSEPRFQALLRRLNLPTR